MIDKVRELLGQDIENPEDDEEESAPTPPLADEDEEEEADDSSSESIEGDLDQQVKGLESKVNDLETETDTNQNRIESLQNDIDTVEDNLDEIEDNIRDLLGIYDAFSARVNPLVEGDFDSLPATSGDRPDSSFDLTDEDEGPVEFGDSDEESDDAEDDEEVENVRTLSDLKNETLDEEPEPKETEQHRVYSFAGTYASEVVAYEWLSMLLNLSGTSGTLRALSYYHDIGWISADVKKALQRRLAGADFEGDGERRDLRADDHAESLSYVIKLEELEENKRHR